MFKLSITDEIKYERNHNQILHYSNSTKQTILVEYKPQTLLPHLSLEEYFICLFITLPFNLN